MTSTNSNKIWIDDFNVLFEKDKLLTFLPIEGLSKEEKINSIVRFSLYLSVLLVLAKNNYKYIYIFLITLGVTYFLYKHTNLIKEPFLEDNNSKYLYYYFYFYIT